MKSGSGPRLRGSGSSKGDSQIPKRIQRRRAGHAFTPADFLDLGSIYLHPVVVGHGKRYFAGPRPQLRLVTHDSMGEDVIRLTYVPA